MTNALGVRMSYINTNDLDDLLWGNPAAIAADLGVTVSTVRRWKAGAPVPAPCVKLLKLRYGDLSGLLGKDWEGFSVGRDGLLYIPTWRRGWTPGELSASFYTIRASNWYKRQHKNALRDLESVRAELWALRKVLSVTGQSVSGSALPRAVPPRMD